MISTLPTRTKATQSLSGFVARRNVVSPYYLCALGHLQKTTMAKARIIGFTSAGNPGAYIQVWDGAGAQIGVFSENITLSATSITPDAILGEVYSSCNSTLQSDAGVTLALSDWSLLEPELLPTAPTSYQTIVSQTGTAAPAVAGGFTPTSTYASGTTFTWARTGVGVYTLTASTAVFNTSGKTSVFVSPLQNLNGAIRATVTSTTVITVTTAVQSLAVLGLLGFTATNTDALLSGTMLYVQTYA